MDNQQEKERSNVVVSIIRIDEQEYYLTNELTELYDEISILKIKAKKISDEIMGIYSTRRNLLDQYFDMTYNDNKEETDTGYHR